jgi:hypothetical protein
MNEHLIREIANASSEYAESTVSYYDGTKDGLDYPSKMMKVRDLKFAELIVRECALQCNHNDDMDRILEHFGVEE